MGEFVSALFAFPTFIFTVLLGLVVIYWLLVLLGALGIEIFDISGLGEAAEGMDAASTGLGGLFVSLGLAGVPMMVLISLLVFWAWLLAFFGTEYLVSLVSGGLTRVLIGAVVVLLAIGGAVLLSALSIYPFHQVFMGLPAAQRGQNALVGKVCKITTLRVDERFGQAVFDDGGAGIILAVRSRQPNSLGKGSKALIISYDQIADTYDVRRYDDSAESELWDA
jgi:hypothetical protein